MTYLSPVTVSALNRVIRNADLTVEAVDLAPLGEGKQGAVHFYMLGSVTITPRQGAKPRVEVSLTDLTRKALLRGEDYAAIGADQIATIGARIESLFA